MNFPLYLFCGGPAYGGDENPKPLIRIRENRTLIIQHLLYIRHHRKSLPSYVTLLCDDGQEAAFNSELKNLSYPVPIYIKTCGKNSSTLKKFKQGLQLVDDPKAIIQFGYPDIFSFEELSYPSDELVNTNHCIYISAATLTSRFPRLIVNLYNNEVMGISNYSSPIPANPLYVFGGDLWGRIDCLQRLIKDFESDTNITDPSLEYDLFFWLINHKKLNCVVLHGERLWIDSPRDINQLLARTGNL